MKQSKLSKLNGTKLWFDYLLRFIPVHARDSTKEAVGRVLVGLDSWH